MASDASASLDHATGADAAIPAPPVRASGCASVSRREGDEGAASDSASSPSRIDLGIAGIYSGVSGVSRGLDPGNAVPARAEPSAPRPPAAGRARKLPPATKSRSADPNLATSAAALRGHVASNTSNAAFAATRVATASSPNPATRTRASVPATLPEGVASVVVAFPPPPRAAPPVRGSPASSARRGQSPSILAAYSATRVLSLASEDRRPIAVSSCAASARPARVVPETSAPTASTQETNARCALSALLGSPAPRLWTRSSAGAKTRDASLATTSASSAGSWTAARASAATQRHAAPTTSPREDASCAARGAAQRREKRIKAERVTRLGARGVARFDGERAATTAAEGGGPDEGGCSRESSREAVPAGGEGASFEGASFSSDGPASASGGRAASSSASGDGTVNDAAKARMASTRARQSASSARAEERDGSG